MSVRNHLSVVSCFIFSALWGGLSPPFYVQVLKLCPHHTPHLLPLPTKGSRYVSHIRKLILGMGMLPPRNQSSAQHNSQSFSDILSILKHRFSCKTAEMWALSNWAAASAFKNYRFSLQGMGLVLQKQKLYNHLLDTRGWEPQWYRTHAQTTGSRLKSEVGTNQKVISNGKNFREKHCDSHKGNGQPSRQQDRLEYIH